MPQRLASTARGSLINSLSEVVLRCGRGRWPSGLNEVAARISVWHLTKRLCLAVLGYASEGAKAVNHQDEAVLLSLGNIYNLKYASDKKRYIYTGHFIVSDTYIQSHWRPINFKIHFESLLLTFKAVHGRAAANISEL